MTPMLVPLLLLASICVASCLMRSIILILASFGAGAILLGGVLSIGGLLVHYDIPPPDGDLPVCPISPVTAALLLGLTLFAIHGSTTDNKTSRNLSALCAIGAIFTDALSAAL